MCKTVEPRAGRHLDRTVGVAGRGVRGLPGEEVVTGRSEFRSRGEAGRVQVGKNADANDDRPPICPACGVTMGITIDENGSTRYVCLECGFSDDSSKRSELRVSDLPPRRQDAGVREWSR